jgi:hypothetical protein
MSVNMNGDVETLNGMLSDNAVFTPRLNSAGCGTAPRRLLCFGSHKSFGLARLIFGSLVQPARL